MFLTNQNWQRNEGIEGMTAETDLQVREVGFTGEDEEEFSI